MTESDEGGKLRGRMALAKEKAASAMAVSGLMLMAFTKFFEDLITKLRSWWTYVGQSGDRGVQRGACEGRGGGEEGEAADRV